MEKNRKIIICIGIPASGKSTWSKDFVKKNSNYVRVNRDEFRLMLKDSQLCENKVEDMITNLVHNVIAESLTKKLNVIVDNTNLKVRYIDAIIQKFQYLADIDFRIFDISLNKAIERDNQRDKKVGEGVIKKMYKDYQILLDTFDFQPIKVRKGVFIQPDYESILDTVVIFDIDGTLALMGNRGPFDWEYVDRDLLNKVVAEHIQHHKNLGRKIFLLTGRDESCRKLTEEWCAFYGVDFDMMYMRSIGDNRKDTYVKREIYENHIKGKYNVYCVYDDRLSVVRDTWYKLGIFTFCVNQGLIEF